MKICTLPQLLAEQDGVIFREFEPMVWHGDWMRYLGPCDENDFFYHPVGPDLSFVGGSDGPAAIFISNDESSRDGCYEDGRQFIVLEEKDLCRWADQLLGKAIEPLVWLFDESNAFLTEGTA